jgi:flagellar export protein FliJ
MKSRESLIRFRRFQVDEKRRHVAQIETMMADFEQMAAELDRQIVEEQDRAGIHDVAHFAYPTFAKAARQRRDNLRNSQMDLLEQKKAAEGALAEAEEELAKAEMLESRDARAHGDNSGPRQATA